MTKDEEIEKLKATCLALEEQVKLLIKTEIKLTRTQGELLEMNKKYEEYSKTLEQKVEDRTKELSLSEKRFKDIALSSSDWIWEADNDGRFTYCSEKVYYILGYTNKELIGKCFYDLIPENKLTQLKKIASVFVSKRKHIRNAEIWIKTKEGKPICLRTYGLPVIDEYDILKGYRGISTNITEKKKTTEALVASELQYRSLFENSKDGIILVDYDSAIILDINPFLLNLLGSNKEETINKKFWEVISFNKFKNAKLLFQDLQEKKSLDFKHLYLKTKSYNYINVKFKSDVYSIGKQKVIQCNIRDISQSVWAEKLLDTLNKAVIGMSTQLTLDDIFNVVSQELRKIDFSSMLFPIDINTNNLFVKYLNFNSVLLKRIEKLIGSNHENFALNILDPEEYKRIIENKETVFIENILDLMKKIFPQSTGIFSHEDSKILNISKAILAPLVVNNKIKGLLSVLSNDLTEKDIPSITAFAIQVSASWYKVELIQNLNNNLNNLLIAEKEVKRERILLRTLINNLPDTIYVKDTEGRKLIANKADLKVMNVKSETEVLGKTDLEIFRNEDGMRGYAEDLMVLQTGNPILNEELVYYDKNGKTNWRLTSKIPLYNESNHITGLIGVGHDITVHKEIEEALKQSEQRYRELTNMLPVGIYETDLKGNLTFGNDTAFNWFGYNALGNPVIKDITQFICEKDRKQAKENFLRIISSGDVSSGEYDMIRKDGSMFPVIIT